MNCRCHATLNTQIWSKEKFHWSQKYVGLKFPTHFSILTGCAVSISKHEVLFIGGHHTKHFIPFYTKYFLPLEQASHYYPVAIPVNNQVIKYDFKSNEWENITNIPIVKVSKALSRYQSNWIVFIDKSIIDHICKKVISLKVFFV